MKCLNVSGNVDNGRCYRLLDIVYDLHWSLDPGILFRIFCHCEIRQVSVYLCICSRQTA